VVTGGAGFIGSHLVDELIQRGYDVRVIDNLAAGKKEQVNPKAEFHQVDIRDKEALSPIMKGADYVFHLAALPRVQFSIDNPEEADAVNIGGTLNVLLAAKDAGVKRFVYSASGSAYGEQQEVPFREEMHARPISPYGLHKYVGEHYARVFSVVYGLPAVSLRYFNVYGSRLDPTGPYALVIAKFLQQRKDGQVLTVTGDGEQTRDFTHVRDVVRANILAAESGNVGAGEVINVGAGRNMTVNRIAELVGGEVEYVPARLEPRHARADRSRAKELLGWEPEVLIEKGVLELLREWGLDCICDDKKCVCAFADD